jgi:phosphoglycolate phosphatase-like HAD superfamily hydrolase
MRKAAIFDVDGTLVDTVDQHARPSSTPYGHWVMRSTSGRSAARSAKVANCGFLTVFVDSL